MSAPHGNAGSAAVSIHRYPRRALAGAWARVAIGVAVAGGLAFATLGNIVLSVICVTILLIFLAYGARTFVRGTGKVIVDADGLRVTGLRPVAVAWKQLTGLRLAYYTTRRDGESGWMELSVHGRSGRVTIDSDIDGFADIAARALDAAEAAGTDLSPASLRNFDAVLGRPSRAWGGPGREGTAAGGDRR